MKFQQHRDFFWISERLTTVPSVSYSGQSNDCVSSDSVLERAYG